MNEGIIRDALHGILTGEWAVGDTALESVRVSLSQDNELRVTLPDGNEYYLTITSHH